MSWLTALLCPLFGFGLAVVVIVLLVRSVGRFASNTAASRPKPLNVITELGADGFWLRSFAPGSIIYYQYWSAGVAHPGQTAFQPGIDGRQFVYTGIRPEQVAVVRVEGSSGAVISNMPPVLDDDASDIASAALGGAAFGGALDALPNPQPPAPRYPNAY
jgi:hypothetical protein